MPGLKQYLEGLKALGGIGRGITKVGSEFASTGVTALRAAEGMWGKGSARAATQFVGGELAGIGKWAKYGAIAGGAKGTYDWATGNSGSGFLGSVLGGAVSGGLTGGAIRGGMSLYKANSAMNRGFKNVGASAIKTGGAATSTAINNATSRSVGHGGGGGGINFMSGKDAALRNARASMGVNSRVANEYNQFLKDVSRHKTMTPELQARYRRLKAHGYTNMNLNFGSALGSNAPVAAEVGAQSTKAEWQAARDAKIAEKRAKKAAAAKAAGPPATGTPGGTGEALINAPKVKAGSRKPATAGTPAGTGQASTDRAIDQSGGKKRRPGRTGVSGQPVDLGRPPSLVDE